MLRQPICTLVGHVDHGKSSIIEHIKNISITKTEAGKITQSIKAYPISSDVIKSICKSLLSAEKIRIKGLLFIDSPGHAAFSNLRKRGGSLADIAIIVIDINEGIMPQTVESIEILKENKTPFIIALNKIDLINGWSSKLNTSLVKSISEQSQSVKKSLDEKLYNIVGRLYDFGINGERFDRVEDFAKTVSMVPLSAKTGEGMPELLMVITGLAQRFLESDLEYSPESPAEGTVLEIKEEKGLGLCMDVIIYRGKIKINDTIVIGTLQKPVITKAKGLFLEEKNIKEAEAAAGIKISAHGIENVIPGMPLKVANKNLEKIKTEIEEQVEEITFELDEDGIVIKADSIGSLEGLINLLKEKNIQIKKASTGNISKKDIREASATQDILNKVIVGFNIKPLEDLSQVKQITGKVIYHIVEELEEWQKKQREELKLKAVKNLPKVCKIKILENYIFRQSNPVVCGIEILAGTAVSGTRLMKDGDKLTEIKEMQDQGKKIAEAKRGQQLAASLPGITAGKDIKEKDILYSDLTETEFRIYKKIKDSLTEEEKDVLKKIAEIKRKNNPGWGV